MNASLRISRRKLLSGIAASSLTVGGARRVFAQVRVPITGGEAAPLPIALPNFVAGTAADGEVAVGVTQVITNNLRRSGLFAPIDQAAYIDKTINTEEEHNSQKWMTP